MADEKKKECYEEDHCPYRAKIRTCFLEKTVYCLNIGFECPYKRKMKNATLDVYECCTKEENT